MLDIQKDVPMPPKAKPPGSSPSYPWHDMEVGDCIPFATDEQFERARRAAANWGKRHGVEFKSRAKVLADQESETGGTVWRTA